MNDHPSTAAGRCRRHLRDNVGDNDEFFDVRNDLKDMFGLPLKEIDRIWRGVEKQKRLAAQAATADAADATLDALAESKIQRVTKGAPMCYCPDTSTAVVDGMPLPLGSTANRAAFMTKFGLVKDSDEDVANGCLSLGRFVDWLIRNRCADRWIMELSGWGSGIRDIGKERVMICRGAVTPEGTPGDLTAWPWFLKKLIPAKAERDALCHTLSRLRRALRNDGTPPHMPVAGMLIVGPRKAGKTLLVSLMSLLVRGDDGGCVDPTQFFTGETPFNEQLAYKPLLVADDRRPFFDSRINRRLGDNLKKYLASDEIEVHGKKKTPWTARTTRTVVLLMNDDYDSLGAAPALRETIEDKVHVIRTEVGIPQDALVGCFVRRLKEEIPAMRRWLDEEVPRLVPDTDARWGIPVAQSPSIRSRLFDISESGAFATVLADLLFPEDAEPGGPISERKIKSAGSLEVRKGTKQKIRLVEGDYVVTSQDVRELLSRSGHERSLRENVSNVRSVGRRMLETARHRPESVGMIERTTHNHRALWYVRRSLAEATEE